MYLTSTILEDLCQPIYLFVFVWSGLWILDLSQDMKAVQNLMLSLSRLTRSFSFFVVFLVFYMNSSIHFVLKLFYQLRDTLFERHLCQSI